MNKRVGIVIGVLVIIALFAGVIIHFLNTSDNEPIEEGVQIPENVIYYNGSRYIYNSNIINILFLGIDTTDSLDRFTEPAYAGQSDGIFILSLNRETGEASILQINRNAMTDIDIYSTAGQVYKTIPGQVTLQYAYATGGSHSAWAAKKTISEMMFNLPIDGYFVMNIEGIAAINDALGGVDVTMPCDYTVIDPEMTEGATVHLMGEASQSFVRYRDVNEFNSVEDRMVRQVLYITAFLDKLCSGNALDVYNVISPYLNDTIITNLSADELNSLASYEYSGCQVDLVPGRMVETDRYEEYYIDEDALELYIVEHFYLPY